jgi:hypothetical protein
MIIEMEENMIENIDKFASGFNNLENLETIELNVNNNKIEILP